MCGTLLYIGLGFDVVMSHNTLVTLLINSGPVLSYHHTVNGIHTITIMPWESCHDHTLLIPYPFPDTLLPWLHSPSAIVSSHISCFSPIHNFHFKYNYSCMMLCSDPNPVHMYYVIPLHVITLTILLLPTLHPHFHQYCHDSFLV